MYIYKSVVVGLFSFGGFFGGVTVITVSEVKSFFSIPWTVAYQAPLSMGFSRQKYWSGLLFPPPGDSPGSGIKPVSPVSSALQANSLPTEPQGPLQW